MSLGVKPPSPKSGSVTDLRLGVSGPVTVTHLNPDFPPDLSGESCSRPWTMNLCPSKESLIEK